MDYLRVLLILEKKRIAIKLKKKGYKTFRGMQIEARNLDCESSFSFITGQDKANRFEVNFSWSIKSDPENNRATDIIHRLIDICSIDYAYSYPTTNKVNLGEWHEKKGLLSITSYKPKSERLWNDHIPNIVNGKIKKLYPINFFNKEQLKSLMDVSPIERTVYQNNGELWKLSLDEIKNGNKKLSNIVLKNK